MLKGSCLCGAIVYQLNQAIEQIVFCHCHNCQKATGSAFNSAAVIQTDQFKLISGQDQLKSFSSSVGVNRYFCRQCGSPLYSSRDNDKNHYRLRIGTLDSPIEPKNKSHIFTTHKAAWFDICDDYPQYKERP
ncbi:GFA family protein [Neisseria sp. Ec49-e6-T10]|uniref:GFA family protein n=1 Tax=Neisseria sp. Ec49-e6-T10 TaxID=3140744 RepID=UPI003EB7C747